MLRAVVGILAICALLLSACASPLEKGRKDVNPDMVALYESCKNFANNQNDAESLLCKTAISVGIGSTLNTMIFFYGGLSKELTEPQSKTAHNNLKKALKCKDGQSSPLSIWEGSEHFLYVAQAFLEWMNKNPQNFSKHPGEIFPEFLMTCTKTSGKNNPTTALRQGSK